MFIFPPFNEIFLQYMTTKATAEKPVKIGPKAFLGTRRDGDKEHARLYRSLARKIERKNLADITSEAALIREIRRYQLDQSAYPEIFLEVARLKKESTHKSMIARAVYPIIHNLKNDDGSVKDNDWIFKRISWSEEIALKARKGEATAKDMCSMPWLLLKPLPIPHRNETSDARVERLVSCDVVLFLWVIALMMSAKNLDSTDIDHLIPDRTNKFGQAWFLGLSGFTDDLTPDRETKLGPKSKYRHVASFLVSGDLDGGARDTLADELSAIERGKQRLTSRAVKRHSHYLETAMATKWYNHPEKHQMAKDIALLMSEIGNLLGYIQFCHHVVLSDLRNRHPKANLTGAFEAGLACWPALVKLSRQ
jgi:hypothetical protein